jgi:hypothetical protein
MENTRKGENEGHFEQLADIKLAGKISGKEDFNPIADQAEMLTTRVEEKNVLDYDQMKLGAEMSPDYMLAVGNKMFRLFRYNESEKNLFDALAGVDPINLKKLSDDLSNIEKLLHTSPVALIGASIILIKQPDGSIKPLLIDPAHLQVNADKREEVNLILQSNEKDKVYYGTSEMFNDRKTSNLTGVRALTVSVSKLQSLIMSRRVNDSLFTIENMEKIFNSWGIFG